MDKGSGNIRHVGFSDMIFNYPSPWSAFKTLSSLPYVLAGIEKKNKNLEDIILKDIHGHISELLYSNIFWIRQDKFFTPTLDTGCIRGVMRTHLIRKFKQLSIPFEEVKVREEELLRADHIISANVSGLRAVAGIENHKFKPYPDLDRWLP
jgi:branched-chain amino acid aminotransferase/4-amino-4-deoxychorismate lyase